MATVIKTQTVKDLKIVNLENGEEILSADKAILTTEQDVYRDDYNGKAKISLMVDE
ncbi:MAG: hypothetical protein WC769_13065 [Thermodesulfovibrionales bacterium]|jgi:hypothetical protein